jgi:hypothetical protein
MSERSGPESDICTSTPLELEGILHRAFEGEPGGAEGDVQLQGIGRILVPQHEDGAADEMDQERLAFELALQLQPRPLVLRRLAPGRLHGAIEPELPLGVLVGHMAIIDLQMSYDRRFRTLLRRDLLGDRRGDGTFLLAPVEVALVVAFEKKLRRLHRQLRQHEMAAEQRPEPDVEIDELGLQHMFGLAPIGVGDLDILKADMGRPAPVDPDAADLGRASGDGAGVVLDLGADIVGGGKDVDEAAGGGDQKQEAAKGPGQDFEGSSHLDRPPALRTPEIGSMFPPEGRYAYCVLAI